MTLNRWLLLLCPVAVLTLISFFTLSGNDGCVYIRFYGLRFRDFKDTIVIGRDGNIAFNEGNVDSGYLKILPSANGYRWKTIRPAYIKFNDTNFNKHPVLPGDVIKFGSRSLTYEALIEKTAVFRLHQTYFELKDLFNATRTARDEDDFSGNKLGSLVFYDQKKGEFQIFLLDSLSSLLTRSAVYKYDNEDSLRIDRMNVELVKPQSSYFIVGSNPLFHNRNVNATTVRTEWQANQLLFNIDKINRATTVFFSQPLVVMLNQPTIDSIYKRSSAQTIQISQETDLMDKKSFYFEKFSSLFGYSLFTIQRAVKNKMSEQVTFNERLADGSIVDSVEPLTSSFEFNIPSESNPEVEVFGKYQYVSPARMIIPFAVLVLVFGASMLATAWLTNENRFIYGRFIRTIPESEQTATDFESIKIGGDYDNKSFWLLRLPVFYFVLLLMCFKMVVATKLTFTHPFFPQLYFIAIFMALTTPVFLAYFFVRNSWSMPALRASRFLLVIPHRVFFSLVLALAVTGLFWVSWAIAGDCYYSNYLDIYTIKYSISGFWQLLHNQSLLKDKFFQIPLAILAIPPGLLLYDLSSRPVSNIAKFRNVGGKWLSMLRGSDGLLIVMLVLTITKSATLLHVVAITWLLFYFRWLLKKSDSKNAAGKVATEGTSINKWSIALMVAVSLVLVYFKIKGDQGILINYFLVIAFALFLTIIILIGRHFEDGRYRLSQNWLLPIVPVSAFIALAWIYGISHTPKVDDLGREVRRVNTIINKDKALETGGRQYLSDLQFLEIAQVNAISNIERPSFHFVNRDRPIHPFISKGLYPVIINDLNAITWLDYGGWVFVVITLFSWLFFMLNRQKIWYTEFVIAKKGLNQLQFDMAQLFRFVPALIIISNSLWMLLSFFNIVFFTGRVINGFGVDSIADWFELIAFSALMGIVIFENSKLDQANADGER